MKHFLNIEKSKQYLLQGQIKIHGLSLSIENRKGSVRKGTDPDGKEWKTLMTIPYGYIKGVLGKDKDHLDCFVGDDRKSEIVFVVNQVKPWVKGKPFDEHKVMFGFNNSEDAKKGYLKHYDSPGYFGFMTSYTIGEFKKLIKYGKKGVYKVDGNTFKKAVDNKLGHFINIEKARVKSHTRKTKSGKLSQVKEYVSSRVKKKIERKEVKIEVYDAVGNILMDMKYFESINDLEYGTSGMATLTINDANKFLTEYNNIFNSDSNVRKLKKQISNNYAKDLVNDYFEKIKILDFRVKKMLDK